MTDEDSRLFTSSPENAIPQASIPLTIVKRAVSQLLNHEDMFNIGVVLGRVRSWGTSSIQKEAVDHLSQLVFGRNADPRDIFPLERFLSENENPLLSNPRVVRLVATMLRSLQLDARQADRQDIVQAVSPVADIVKEHFKTYEIPMVPDHKKYFSFVAMGEKEIQFTPETMDIIRKERDCALDLSKHVERNEFDEVWDQFVAFTFRQTEEEWKDARNRLEKQIGTGVSSEFAKQVMKNQKKRFAEKFDGRISDYALDMVDSSFCRKKTLLCSVYSKLIAANVRYLHSKEGREVIHQAWEYLDSIE